MCQQENKTVLQFETIGLTTSGNSVRHWKECILWFIFFWLSLSFYDKSSMKLSKSTDKTLHCPKSQHLKHSGSRKRTTSVTISTVNGFLFEQLKHQFQTGSLISKQILFLSNNMSHLIWFSRI